LLIEDNTEHAEWIELLLIRRPPERFLVDRVAGLVQALIRLAQLDVDVILLDLGLPELEGFRSHTAIRSMAPNVPVVILTGDDRAISRDVALSGGAQYYLLKSEVSSEQLQNAVIHAYRGA
jgi:DNA-binding response OmpR family regulator